MIFKPVILSKNEFDQIKAGDLSSFSKQNIKSLYKKGILVDDKETDQNAYRILRDSFNNSPDRICLMYLIPYSGCNLACRYCFIGQIDNKKATFMSIETAENALRKFYNHLKKNRIKKGQIIFYGGEPTLNFSVIEKISNDIMRQKLPIILSMITNATALTDEMIKICEDNHISLGISLDGPKALNDYNRFFKSGTESVYQKAIQTISKLKKTSVDFAISLTLSQEVLDDNNLLNWIKELDVKNINFNLLHFTHKNEDWKSYYQKASRFLFQAYDQLFPLNIKDDRILRKFRSFHSEKFTVNDCAAVGSEQITIRPDGSMTICHGYWNTNEENCGNINKDDIDNVFQTPVYHKWKTNLTVNKKKCLKCPAIYICGGGCPKQSESLFGSQTHVDSPFCIHAKYTLKELLKRQYKENTKGD
ncbi:MAG: SPASM domain-containing protein [Alphaproteobacteria bacterium]|nr:SPASM domain-containing protein [Alphaproteobacteria bacterium]